MTSFSVHIGRFRHLSTIFIIALIFGAGFAFGTLNAPTAAQSSITVSPEVQEAFSALWQAYNLIQSEYIDDVELSTLVDGAIFGMVDALGDPFSGYMTPSEFRMMNADLDGEIEGIGVVIRTREGSNEIEVVGILDGAPAKDAGILPGDIFVAVDGEDVTALSQLQLAGRVRGPAGSQVEITMRRGDELITFVITRARIVIPNVETRILADEIGYIKLNQFNATASADMRAAFEDLNVNALNGLIVDFRNNPGGLLSSAVDVASLFIESGPILTEVFSDDNQRVFSATGQYADIQVPIVILVNEGSASASELVAGALQDRDVATIVGETTFGKGTVQTWSALVNGGGVRLTIARWLTPGGRWIHEAGVEPDIVVEWTPLSYDDPDDPQLDAAVEFLLSLQPVNVISTP
ncbi:MAG: S41 family peptidase [Aggregatilineales bacterium]